ncbi:WYL domain-containing protein [Acidisoma cellulosilytica]|uniref:WYL domain-containing protein n=1 Tax=Acidisoma cellulosilyticum TaxID=2802395 RepID=A0A963Z7H9_9PROT|nr:WYL domain-containing protein [Acidisoma cellulosilyticum]MCB8884016.1 WYL domain-containing protein [Acidisoma cellulosilyticum]
MSIEDSDSVRWGVRRRLEFIDFRLFWDGRFNRRDLADTFGISAQQASADIALYTAQAPANLRYDPGARTYVRTSAYRPTLMRASSERYLLQLVAIENRWMSKEDTWFDQPPPIENVSLLRKRTDSDILLLILDAINQRGQLEIRYKSITGSPEPKRLIAPHALFHAGGRWYVRAWSGEHRDFRDYNLFRIESVSAIGTSVTDPALDYEWSHRIDLEIVPNPVLLETQRAAVAMEYGMTDGKLVVTSRLSQSFYLMTENNLDVEPNVLIPGKQPLVLLNRSEVVAARETARKLSTAAVARASA